MTDQEREALVVILAEAIQADDQRQVGDDRVLAWADDDEQGQYLSNARAVLAALAAREERNPDGKIQMYHLGGEYPELPTRLLEWPDLCTEVDRANAAEERVAELEAAAREDTERPDAALVVIALRTTDRHVQRRLETALSIAASYDEPPDTAPCVFAKPVSELVANDLDRLAEFMGWPAVRDLNLGVDVVTERDPKP